MYIYKNSWLLVFLFLACFSCQFSSNNTKEQDSEHVLDIQSDSNDENNGGSDDSASEDNFHDSSDADSDSDTDSDTDTDSEIDTHCDTDTDIDGDTDTDADADADADADSDSDSDGDSDADGGSGDGGDSGDDAGIPTWICETVFTDLVTVPSRVMLLEDKSESMNNDGKWSDAIMAIRSMATNFDEDIALGLDLFSVQSGYPETASSSCTVGTSAVLDVGINNSKSIANKMFTYSPSGFTPLLLAISNYSRPDYAPIFQNRDGKSYLVIISDGKDTCGLQGIADANGYDVNQDLTDVTTEIHQELGISTIVIGFGHGVSPDQLNAIAEAGGTEFDTYLQADDDDELEEALQTIGESVAISCRFELEEFEVENPNLDWINIYVNDEVVKRDDGCHKNTGWSWIDKDKRIIEFCTEACNRVRNEAIEEIRVELACSEKEVIVI